MDHMAYRIYCMPIISAPNPIPMVFERTILVPPHNFRQYSSSLERINGENTIKKLNLITNLDEPKVDTSSDDQSSVITKNLIE